MQIRLRLNMSFFSVFGPDDPLSPRPISLGCAISCEAGKKQMDDPSWNKYQDGDTKTPQIN